MQAVGRQPVADAERALRRDHRGAAGAVVFGGRGAEPRRRVEPQAGDAGAARQREVAVPVLEAAVLLALQQLDAEHMLELVGRQGRPDGARVGRGGVAVAARRVAQQDGVLVGEIGPQGVVGVLRGAEGRPQGAVGVEVGQGRLARAPVALEQRRGVAGARQDEGDVDRGFGGVGAGEVVGVEDGAGRRRAVAGVVEIGPTGAHGPKTTKADGRLSCHC